MSEKHLLLPSARSGVLVSPYTPSHWWRKAALAFGALAIVVGAADMVDRVSHITLSDSASLAAFAPLAALDDPAVRAALSGGATSTNVVAPIIPARIVVPSLRIDAVVEQVGKKADGAMGTPSGFGRVAWYSPGAKPGAAGNAVFAGHVNNALTTGGVFSHLSQIKFGARIEVTDKAGKSIAYSVTSIEEYPADTAPAEAIFAATGPSQIILITCEGQWDPSVHSFDKRLVIVARPI